MAGFFKDVEYALRTLARSPGFTAVAVLSLALGIGASTAVFSVIDAALLDRLPVPRPEELVLLHWEAGENAGENPAMKSMNGWMTRTDTGKVTSTSFSRPLFERFREDNRALSSLFGFLEVPRMNLAVGDEAELVGGLAVSGGYFPGLEIDARIGRAVTPEDDRPGAPPVAVLSHAYWRRNLGADPEILGRTVRVNGQPVTVVGVAPPGFRGTGQVGTAPALFLPLAALDRLGEEPAELADPTYWWLQLMGRRSPGVSLESSRADLDAILGRVVAAQLGETLRSGREEALETPRLTLTSGARGLEQVRDGMVRPLVVALAVAALVLAIACVNLANLLLARSGARAREVAVRMSLGAGGGRLARQLLTESGVLAIAGGAAGLLLAAAGTGPLMNLLPAGIESAGAVEASLDWRVVAFTAAVTLAAAALFGLAPALRASRVDLTPALKDGTAGSGRRRHGVARTLLVAQVALSVAVLTVAGLFALTVWNLMGVDLGFETDGVALFRMEPKLSGYEGPRLAALYDELLGELRALPGVRSASLTLYPPLAGFGWYTSTRPEAAGSDEEAGVNAYVVPGDPELLPTLGIPLLRGRGFAPADGAGSPRVALVNETFAREAFGEGSPLGERLRPMGDDGAGIEIVGLVADARTQDLHQPTAPVLYLPWTQHLDKMGRATFLIRTAGDPAAGLPAAQAVVRRIAPELPMFEAGALSGRVNRAMASERQFAQLSLLSSLLVLALASIGLYGLLSYAGAGRTRELGVRMALGADRSRVMRLVMRELRVVLVGILLGAFVAWGAMSWLESLLFGLEPGDLAPLAAAALVMLTVAALAA
ncbi:MAG TPA: ABC transporter permease, partial [Thermoanaerobaculia bacterium]|nr:ABC transporter permease [Thermoanaerobaculia bacterium]